GRGARRPRARVRSRPEDGAGDDRVVRLNEFASVRVHCMVAETSPDTLSVDALERLYRARYRRFLNVALAVTGNLELARDAVQDAFANAIRGRFGFRGGGSAEAWVWSIVVNSARSAVRGSS